MKVRNFEVLDNVLFSSWLQCLVSWGLLVIPDVDLTGIQGPAPGVGGCLGKAGAGRVSPSFLPGSFTYRQLCGTEDLCMWSFCRAAVVLPQSQLQTPGNGAEGHFLLREKVCPSP